MFCFVDNLRWRKRWPVTRCVMLLQPCRLAFVAVVHVTADFAVGTGGRLRPCARSFATKTRRNNVDMGLKQLVEFSASISEMHVMDFDGCGCVSAL
jgi:hypothetical protein